MNCPLCQSEKSKVVYLYTRSGRIVQCERCEFVFSDTTPGATRTDKGAVVDDPMVYDRNAEHRLSHLKGVTGIDGGKLLDVGCYDGGFAAAAGRRGFSPFGVETVEEAARRAKDQQGVEVFVGRYEDVKIPAAPFDVISFIHSFEHLPDPHRVLERTRNLLAAKGALLIEIPNYDAWSRKLLGRHWRQFISDHRLFYTERTLRRVLESEGFALMDAQTVPKELSFDLLSDRVERYYSALLGRSMGRAFNAAGIGQKTLRMNLGDILLVVAVHKSAQKIAPE